MARNKRHKSITRPVSSKPAASTSALSERLGAEAAAVSGIKASKKLAWLLLIGGLLGFAAAFTLLLERLELFKNPDYVPTCSINPVLSCGSVMITEQAALLGFPNPIIGVATFPVVAAIGALILAGGRFRGWVWGCLQVGMTLGIVFISWLVFQSLYRIRALCPYCMVVWTVMIPMFVSVTLFNLKQLAPRNRGFGKAISVLRRFQWIIVVVWYLVITVMILVRFWYFWSASF